MIGWHKRRAQVGGDEGAILIFALIIVTTIALVVVAILTNGSSSLQATVALRSVAGSSYAADAAANVAINDLRTGYGFTANPSESGFNNSLDGYGCFGNKVGNGGTDSLSLNNFYPPIGGVSASSAYVQCAGESGTGQQSSPVPISSLNKPGYAIITLGGPIDTTGSQGALDVHGGVYSNSSIIGQVSLDAGDAWANGPCTQTTVVAPASLHCNTGQKITDPGVDPTTASRYVSDVGNSVPTLQPLPTACVNGVATFTPGYYDDANALTTASGLCAVSWFQPGTYYFDFHNSTSSCSFCGSTSPLGGAFNTSGGDVWNVPGNTLIAGTPTNPTANGAPSSTVTVPGACVSPISTQSETAGVQFVFGGDSQMIVAKNSQVEICGSYHSGRPPIDFYGLKSGSTPTATNSTGLDVGTNAPTGALWTPSSLTAANMKDGGSGASWTTSSTKTTTATLTAQGFAPGSAVPAGAILTSATLHITHQDGDVTTTSPSASITVGTTTVTGLAITGSLTRTTANLAITGSNLTSLQTQVHKNGYTGATVQYSVTAKANKVTSTAGPILLDLTYYLPVLRGEGGTCIDGSSGSCKLLTLLENGNNKIAFYLQGTTYVPYADVSVTLSNFSSEVAKFGIVARQLEFAINNGNPRYTGPVFEIPDNSPGYGYENTTVDLTVYLCLGQPTCSAASGTQALTVRVQVWDPSGVPAPPGRQISVLSWSHIT